MTWRRAGRRCRRAGRRARRARRRPPPRAGTEAAHTSPAQVKTNTQQCTWQSFHYGHYLCLALHWRGLLLRPLLAFIFFDVTHLHFEKVHYLLSCIFEQCRYNTVIQCEIKMITLISSAVNPLPISYFLLFVFYKNCLFLKLNKIWNPYRLTIMKRRDQACRQRAAHSAHPVYELLAVLSTRVNINTGSACPARARLSASPRDCLHEQNCK